MRAYEFINQKSNKLTMRHLHKLKKIRKLRQHELEQKKSLVAQMYGDPVAHAEKEQQELEQMERQLELVMDKIKNEIQSAEIDNQQREKIRSMAMRTVKRSMKN
ncbi:hypothetical protein [Terasakiella sp.]|uniref:hypothetical protein n=1 Tax=Terasakiella sp. TaxID=2034861 RepID=UPI003AA82768